MLACGVIRDLCRDVVHASVSASSLQVLSELLFGKSECFCLLFRTDLVNKHPLMFALSSNLYRQSLVVLRSSTCSGEFSEVLQAVC